MLKKTKICFSSIFGEQSGFFGEAGQKLTATTWSSPSTAAVFSVFGSAFDFCREIWNRQH